MTAYRSERNTIEDDGEAPDTLQQLLAAAKSDPNLEQEFFRALLDAPLFALRPVSDDHPSLRLLLFTRPDGLQFYPCFTTLARARAAAGRSFVPIRLLGRELLSAMPGMPCVIDPNDSHCTLYPEELAALVCNGTLPRLDVEDAGGRRVHARAPRQLSPWLAMEVHSTLSKIEGAHAAHVAEISEERTPEEFYLLVMVEADPVARERSGRALTLALRPFCESSRTNIVVTTAVSFLDVAVQLYPGG